MIPLAWPIFNVLPLLAAKVAEAPPEITNPCKSKVAPESTFTLTAVDENAILLKSCTVFVVVVPFPTL